MSATHCRIQFGVLVNDVDRWSDAHRAASEAEPGGSYDGWVVDQLVDVMRTAADRFIADHPDLFGTELI